MTSRLADPLSTRRKLLLATVGVIALALPIVFGLINATPSHAQSKAENGSVGAKVSFESASVKLDPSPSPKLHSQIYFPNRFVATSTARWLIEYAYSSRRETCDLAIAICNDEERGYPIVDDQIVGGPEWVKSEMFDIDAKVDDSLAQSDEKWPDQVSPMLQSLLAERFQLKIRRETMDRPAYALVVAKGGPKFAEDDSHPERGGVAALGQGKFQFTSSPLGDLPWVLSMREELGRHVVLDKTGLQGRYSFTFQLPANPAASSPSAGSRASELSEASVSKALQEQLGLILEPTTTPMDTIIIEHIEKPSEN